MKVEVFKKTVSSARKTCPNCRKEHKRNALIERGPGDGAFSEEFYGSFCELFVLRTKINEF